MQEGFFNIYKDLFRIYKGILRIQEGLFSIYLSVIRMGGGRITKFMGGRYSRKASSALAEGTLSFSRSLRIL